MNHYFRRTWAEIDLNKLVQNYQSIRKMAKSAEMMPVVKADAYGHGAEYVAPVLQREGAKWFAVSNIEEAVSLRSHAVTADILILGYTPVEFAEKLSQYNITQAIVDEGYANALSLAAQKASVTVKVQIKIDTGMNRVGIRSDVETAMEIFYLNNLRVTGMFTHFCCADGLSDFEKNYTEDQWNSFYGLIEHLREKGIDPGFCHCNNSASILRCPEHGLSGVRPGIILYGGDPSSEVYDHENLKPVLELHSSVAMVKKIPVGSYIGYGATEKTRREETIATVTIGYADGYPRALSNGKGNVLIGGKRYPIIGRICMDQLMVNMGEDSAKPGDDVVLIGQMGTERITVEEIAEVCGTIPYEILCGISKRVPRVYKMDGEITGVTDYIAQLE